MIRKRSTALLLALFFLCTGFKGSIGQKEDQTLNNLMSGNQRFMENKAAQKGDCGAKRKELLAGQHPSAIVVTCSDSRVPPEVIFDQFLGDIFVIRVAGNVIDPVTLGSIEYAAEHLHTPLLVIMGHDKCGAVTASLEATSVPEGNIGAIVAKILPAAKKAKTKGGSRDEILDNAIRENVILAHSVALRDSSVLKHLVDSGSLRVIEAIYHLDSGAVEILAQSTPAVSVTSGNATVH